MEYNELIFEHIVSEGSSYEVGKFRGDTIKKYPSEVEYFSSPLEGNDYLSVREVDKIMQVFDKYCPGLNEEILGFADSLEIPHEKVVFYANSYENSCNCSQFAALTPITKDNQIYVGRSYEYSTDDELRLCTTRVKGKASHIGFSLHHFGRFDGINEHGLCVTMSAAVPGVVPKSEGCKFWVVIRSLLDNCKDISDAKQLLSQIPISDNANFLLVDKSGKGILVEIACFENKINISYKNSEKYLISTNHYTTEDMIKFNYNRMWQSIERYNIIESQIISSSPNVEINTLKSILANKMPEGVCCHHFEDGLGTLRSMLFNVSKQETEICFGPPSINKWRKFKLNDPVGSKEYIAKYYEELPKNPEQFWGKIT